MKKILIAIVLMLAFSSCASNQPVDEEKCNVPACLKMIERE